MEYGEINPEEKNQYILFKINETLEHLGSTSKWLKTPELEFAYESLRGKTIVMVDDIKMVLQAFVPALMVATEGHAKFIHYENQSRDLLVQEINGSGADIVLLDYWLKNTESEQFVGSSIIPDLRSQGLDAKIIGFSSEREAIVKFEQAGADGCIGKEAGFPEDSVEKLNALTEKMI